MMTQVQPKRIYVDVDDVVSMTTITYPAIVQEQFGKIVAFESLACFDLKTSFDLTENEFHYLFDLIHEPKLLLGFKVMAGARETLEAWADQGHFIEIVTGRPVSVRYLSGR